MNRDLLAICISTVAVLLIAGCAGRQETTAPVSDAAIAPGQVDAPTKRTHPALVPEPLPWGLGVNIHFTQGSKRDLEMLAACGITMIRMDFAWAHIEKEKGKYDFSAHDRLYADMAAIGIRLLLVIDYGNPLYDDGISPHTDEARQAYARMIEAAARHFRGKDVIWEIWNEPNLPRFWIPFPNVDDYAALVKALAPAIRRGDPDACVVAPASSGIALGWLEGCFRQGMLELVDGVSVHPYRAIFYTPARDFFPKSGPARRSLNETKLAPESTIDEYRDLRRLIDKYEPEGKSVPILCGEWGYSTAWMSDEMQAAYLARCWLVNAYCGAVVSIWYDWVDDRPNPKETEHNFGTIHDGKPKAAYTAMQTLIRELSGYRFSRRIPLGSSRDYAMLYVKGREAKLVVWTLNEPHRVALGDGLRARGATGFLGRRIALKDASAPLLSEGPRYLELESAP